MIAAQDPVIDPLRRQLRSRIDRWARELAWARLLDGGARLAADVVIALALIALAARLLPMPPWARWGVFLAGLAGLGTGARRLLLKPWLASNSSAAITLAEEAYPDLREYLRSAWDLAQKTPPRSSSDLRSLHIGQTVEALSVLPHRPLSPLGLRLPTRRSLLAAAPALLALARLAPGISWRTLLCPWTAPSLEAILAIRPGDVVVNEGGSARVSASWKRSSPIAQDEAGLGLWVRDGGTWRRRDWSAKRPGELARDFSSISRPFDYELRWQGIASRRYAILLAAPPRFKSVSVAVVRRGRTAERPLEAGETLVAAKGSALRFVGLPDGDISSAELAVSGEPAPLRMRRAGGAFKAEIRALRDETFSFRLRSPDGRRNPDPLQYALKVVADHPPSIELLWPDRPLAAQPGAKIQILYRAADDFGLRDIALLIEAPGRTRETRPITLFKEEKLSVLDEYSWDLKGLPAGEIGFQLEAVDDAGQKSLSSKGLLRVVDFAARHERSTALLKEAAGRVETLSQAASRAARDFESNKTPSARIDETKFLQSYDGAEEAMKALSRALLSDPYARPEFREQAQSLAAQFSSLHSDAAAASAAGAAGNFNAARDDLEPVQGLANKTLAALQAAQNAESLDQWREGLKNIQDTSRALADEIARLGASEKTSRGTPESRARLDEILARLRREMAALAATISKLPQATAASAAGNSVQPLPLREALRGFSDLEKALAAGDLSRAEALAKRLSQSLAEIDKTLARASPIGGSSGWAEQEKARLAAVEASWSAAERAQEKAVAAAQGPSQSRLSQLVKAEGDLLKDLAARQGLIVSSAEARGPWMPPAPLLRMRGVLAELQSGHIDRAPAFLSGAIQELRYLGAVRASSRKDFGWYAGEEEKIAKALDLGPSLPPEKANPGTEEAKRQGGQSGAKMGELMSGLQALDASSGGAFVRSLEGARRANDEEKRSLKALSRPDSRSALDHAASSLAELQRAKRGFDKAAERELSFLKRVAPGPMPGASGGVFMLGGNSGVYEGPVRLPSVDEYQPPKELRQELEESMKEKRPALYDSLIKSYFRRISE